MKIAFFGHAEIYNSPELENRLIYTIKDVIGRGECELFFGGYGMFDSLAYRCCRMLKESGHSLKLVFVTPYISESYLKNQVEAKLLCFDEVIFPPIEKVPNKFRISARNRYMVECADIVITLVNREYGGAYSAYLHAKKSGKKVINLGKVDK